MIVGNGLIAKAFKEYDNDKVLFFASGVSNSKEIEKKEFEREKDIIVKHIKEYANNKHFVYFSTCSMYDTYFDMSLYTKHKIEMEDIIKEEAKNYNIFRLPQVLGSNNKNQLIGFFFDCIKSKKHFNLFNIERNIIDISDVSFLINSILKDDKYFNTTLNIANSSNYKVLDIVQTIEKICKQKALYSLVEKEGSFNIRTEQIEELITKHELFPKDYLETRIKKYYE